jgi:hypothetical protein
LVMLVFVGFMENKQNRIVVLLPTGSGEFEFSRPRRDSDV